MHGFLVVTPYYNKPPVRGIVEHFAAIASETDRPIVVYNIPGRVVMNIEPDTIAQLAEIPKVTPSSRRTTTSSRRGHRRPRPRALCRRRRPRVPVPRARRRGGVCVYTHVVGPQVKEMVRLFRAGDVEGAGRSTRSCARPRAPPRRHEPDRDQGGAQPPRTRGGRPPPAARRGDGRRARRSTRLPRAARAARARRRLARRLGCDRRLRR